MFLGGTPFPPSLESCASYEGTFPSPFREQLLFGEVHAASREPGQHVEMSYSLRTETDVRGFGGQTSFESAENVRNRVDSVLGTLAGGAAHVAQRGHADVPAIQLESRAAEY